MKTAYNAVLLGVGGKTVDIVFPDFPGCVSQGRSVKDALDQGRDALEFHLEGMFDGNLEIPLLSDDKLLSECLSENKDGITAIVEVEVPESKTVRLNVCLPVYVLSKVDRHVKAHPSESRSGFLAKAALEYAGHHE